MSIFDLIIVAFVYDLRTVLVIAFLAHVRSVDTVSDGARSTRLDRRSLWV